MCGQVGSLMAAEAVKLITGVGRSLLGRVAVLDVLAARWSELPLRPRAQAAPPTTLAELGYDPLGIPVTTAARSVLAAPGQADEDGAPGPSLSITAPAARRAARERGEASCFPPHVRDTNERSNVTLTGVCTN